MRLRRVEFIALAITFAFVCFMGGYFAGSRGSVNIVAVEPQYGAAQQFGAVEPQSAPSHAVSETPPAASSSVNVDAGSNGAIEEIAPVVTESVGDTVALPRGDGKININTASRSELMDLPGIGSALAGRIVDYRSQYGAFSSIDEIMKVSGIGEKRFEAIMDRITV